MFRNIVLAISSFAVLVILYLAYTVLVVAPGTRGPGAPGSDQIVERTPSDAPPLRVAEDVELHGGGRVMFRVFDERTGRSTHLIECETWEPVPGTKNEVRVVAPELTMLLPSGMIAHVEAAEGQLVADRIDKSQMKPRAGWLRGDVRVVIDRETRAQRTPRSTRPEDLITITMPELSFNFERGELSTDAELHVASREFELNGRGLDLVWNQADNRVEDLRIHAGDEFVFYVPAGLLRSLDEASEVAPEPPTAPTIATTTAPRPDRARGSITAYHCRLSGDIAVAQHRRNEAGEDEIIGTLAADEIELLFDVSSRAGRMLGSTATQPTTQPLRDTGNRLVMRWSGPLFLGPAATAANPDEPRLHFIARGAPVEMTRRTGTIRCGEVEYHDETQRIWLRQHDQQPLNIALGPKLDAATAGVYVDRDEDIVKLVGPVVLTSRRGTDPNAPASTIRCAYWAELHLADAPQQTQSLEDPLIEFQQLRAATFVGEVETNLEQQQLTAHRLHVTFDPNAGGETLDAALRDATASGGVQLTVGEGLLDAQRLALDFAQSPGGELYPQSMTAHGAVKLTRGRAYLEGDAVTADLALPTAAQEGGPRFVLRKLDVVGDASLVDPKNRVAARGQRIVANFSGANELGAATVYGTAEEFGLIHAQPYTIRGAQIDLDNRELAAQVDGPSQLSFKTRRSLQGQRSSKQLRIQVTAEERLVIDGRENEIRFEGDVVARSGAEQLKCRKLRLVLENARPPTGLPQPDWQELWQQSQMFLGLADADQPNDDLFRVDAGDDRRGLQKDPVRLIADDAIVISETFAEGDPTPLVHASIKAPLLEVDILNRLITTTGLTQLLMTDRRPAPSANQTRETLGIPSALITRGPSQTAMQCEGSMTYTLGEEGPDRRDAVIFEDAVLFVHRAGREMVNLEYMFPRLAAQPELLDELESRSASMTSQRLECWLAADASPDGRPLQGGALSAPMQIVSLLATGGVYLRDQESTNVREVHAALVEFNRPEGRIDVRGGEMADARIYFEDTATSQFDVHTGPSLVISLREGTILTGQMSGEIRR